VLHSCVREGSLDTMIEDEAANDFRAFFRTHRAITHVFFNGAKAEASYRRHVLGAIDVPLRYRRLPSTSPAHASLSYARKLAAWRAILKAEDES
jgi:hypoxanthine-DNA glycosylase